MIYHRSYHRYRRYHQNPHHYPHRLCYQHCAGLWRVPHGLSVKLSAAQEVESGCVSRLHWLPTFHHLPHPYRPYPHHHVSHHLPRPYPHHHILIIAILHLSRILFSNQIWKVITVILLNATHSKRNSYCWIFGNSKQVTTHSNKRKSTLCENSKYFSDCLMISKAIRWTSLSRDRLTSIHCIFQR